MSVGRMSDLLGNANSGGYAVPAFNIIDELSMDAALRTAADACSPVIVQVSVRTAKFWGPSALHAGFVNRVRRYAVTAVLHLDHCREPEFLLHCLDNGWDSALFDSSHLSYAVGMKLTGDLVRCARRRGAEIEGEFENIARIGTAAAAIEPSERASVADCMRFIEYTGVSSFSPALGTAHGVHTADPVIDYHRATSLAQFVPVVLHGGSGLSDRCLRQVIRSGVSKINFSSVIKERYRMAASNAFTAPEGNEPLTALATVHTQLGELCEQYMRLLGSEGTRA
jgi:ketose-bisphosphate aldolase